MISQSEFGSQAMSPSKQAMPETTKFDGPSGLKTSGSENQFAANSGTHIAASGSGS